MTFQAKWTPEQIGQMVAIVDDALNREAGYADAAQRFDTTHAAVKGIYARAHGRGKGGRPTRKPSDKAPKMPPSYAEAIEQKQDKRRIKTLEGDLYTIRKAVEAFSAATSRPLDPVVRRELGSGIREATPIALLSDAHVEEHVRVGETPVPNEYNPEIAERSIGRFFGGYRWLIDFHRERFAIRDALLWLGGDLMSGHIHEELKETTETAPIETILWLRPRITDGIDFLLEDPKLERLLIPCSYGNHGRNTQKPMRARGAAHSYEWLFYQWLAAHYENEPRVKFLADPSAHQYARVYDFDLHFHHDKPLCYSCGTGKHSLTYINSSSICSILNRSSCSSINTCKAAKLVGREFKIINFSILVSLYSLMNPKNLVIVSSL